MFLWDVRLPATGAFKETTETSRKCPRPLPGWLPGMFNYRVCMRVQTPGFLSICMLQAVRLDESVRCFPRNIEILTVSLFTVPPLPPSSLSHPPQSTRGFPLEKNPKCRVVRVLDLTDTLQSFRQKDGCTKLVSSLLQNCLLRFSDTNIR